MLGEYIDDVLLEPERQLLVVCLNEQKVVQIVFAVGHDWQFEPLLSLVLVVCFLHFLRVVCLNIALIVQIAKVNVEDVRLLCRIALRLDVSKPFKQADNSKRILFAQSESLCQCSVQLLSPPFG